MRTLSSLLVLSLLTTSICASSDSQSLALPSQTATITSLPPAQPSTNSTNPCAFTDRSDLLKRVVSDWQGYNISLLVQTCPGVCELIYGDGNPDVSGIGVMISYVMQFVSTLFAGPLLIYLYVYEAHYSDSLVQYLDMIVADVLPDINTGNGWITIAIMLASAIRLAQDPPIFELDFIIALIWFQWVMMLARSISLTILSYKFKELHLGNVALSNTITFFAVIYTGVLSVSGGPGGNAANYQALVAISHFCIYENDLPIPLPVMPPDDNNSDLTLWQKILLRLFAPLIQMGLYAIVVIAGSIVLFVCYLFYGSLAFVFDKIWRLLPRGLQGLLTTIGVWTLQAIIVLVLLIPGAIWVAGCILFLVSLQSYRDIMALALGKQYQDSYWGFGQVTIMVMLIPSIFSILRKVMKFRPKKKEVAEQHEHEPILTHGSGEEDHDAGDPIEMSFEFDPDSNRRGEGDDMAAESSSPDSRARENTNLQGVSSQSAAIAHEESFELKQRSTFPRNSEDVYLPLHRAG